MKGKSSGVIKWLFLDETKRKSWSLIVLDPEYWQLAWMVMKARLGYYMYLGDLITFNDNQEKASQWFAIRDAAPYPSEQYEKATEKALFYLNAQPSKLQKLLAGTYGSR